MEEWIDSENMSSLSKSQPSANGDDSKDYEGELIERAKKALGDLPTLKDLLINYNKKPFMSAFYKWVLDGFPPYTKKVVLEDEDLEFLAKINTSLHGSWGYGENFGRTEDGIKMSDHTDTGATPPCTDSENE